MYRQKVNNEMFIYFIFCCNFYLENPPYVPKIPDTGLPDEFDLDDYYKNKDNNGGEYALE